MNTINQTLFTARVTDDVPPRLSVKFGKDSLFTRRNAPCEQLTLGDDKQFKISLDQKTIGIEQATSLASGGDYGKSLTLKKISQTDYDCDDEDGVSNRIGNVSHMILQIKNSKLIAEFSSTLPVTQQAPIPVDTSAVKFRSRLIIPPPRAQMSVGESAPVIQQAPSMYRSPKIPSIPVAANLKKPSTFSKFSKWHYLTGCLMDENGNFKEDCGLDSDIEKGIYKAYCKDSSAKDNDLTKDTYNQLLAKEESFEDLEDRKELVDAHTAVDGRLPAAAIAEMIESGYLNDSDIIPYLQFLRLINSNSQNIQQWLAADPSNKDSYQRWLAAEKKFILEGEGGKNK